MAVIDLRQLAFGWWERRQARIERDRAVNQAQRLVEAAKAALTGGSSNASALLGRASEGLAGCLCWEHDPDLREINHLVVAAKEHLDWQAADRAEEPLDLTLNRLGQLGPCPWCASRRETSAASPQTPVRA